ncbi:hypothetical protein TrVFT333_005731 [Trichoderma virens FT-333]|nr:hypothetical protein TrVFT333_005731 [Trichoderma virens FT-333]
MNIAVSNHPKRHPELAKYDWNSTAVKYEQKFALHIKDEIWIMFAIQIYLKKAFKGLAECMIVVTIFSWGRLLTAGLLLTGMQPFDYFRHWSLGGIA